MHLLILDESVLWPISLLYSLHGNLIGDSGAKILSDALRVNRTLENLEFVLYIINVISNVILTCE